MNAPADPGWPAFGPALLVGFVTTMRGDGVWLVVVGAAVALALMVVDIPVRARLIASSGPARSAI